ncbi:MAG: Uma2 family endonuclease [Acidobacteria bacterium]|nr:Uma2 family endonuclease [Acidobacteriota bacterium]
MATQAAIPVEEYLRSSYEHDREYVHGEVVERAMPTKKHGRTQTLLARCLATVEQTHAAYVVTETRAKLDEDLFRIPDVSVYWPPPAGEVPSVPPLVAIEILSPDDPFSAVMKKCAEYRRWGVKHVWVTDPDERKLMVYDDGLRPVGEIIIPEFNLTITPAQIFE